MNNKLDYIFKNSKKMEIDDQSKLVIMSDCHRGSGDSSDNFIQNQIIFREALRYYYMKDFTYIELGDGDDLWEVKNCKDIVKVHLDSFKEMKKFNDSKRLIMIYGNHDIIKQSKDIFKKCFDSYYEEETKQEKSLLEGLNVYESLVLKYKDNDIFLIHGHQVDFLNSTLWRVSQFLVRYIWKLLEYSGVKDPTGSAKNYEVAKSTEKKLEKWSMKNNKILIAGHTHRPIFPKVGQSLYFNDGCCVHPNGITCLEIEDGNIALVRWKLKKDSEQIMVAERKVLDGQEPIIKFFK